MDKGRYKIFYTRISLLLEMMFVTVTLIFLVGFLQSDRNNYKAWLTVPLVLVTAALVPTFIRKKSLSRLGLHFKGIGLSLRALCLICLLIFPALLLGILFLKHYNAPLPMCPVVSEEGWFSWLLYQFIFIALAEEIFFRGYLQSNILNLLKTIIQKNVTLLALVSVIISAVIFAGFHSIIYRDVMSFVTFFPGLVLGWLFYKTKSLLAPVLFHGLANTSYGFLVIMLT